LIHSLNQIPYKVLVIYNKTQQFTKTLRVSMAPIEDPPSASSEEDNSSSGISTSSDDDDDNLTSPPPKSASTTTTLKLAMAESGSSSSTSDSSDSDEEESGLKQQPHVKPIATKSMNKTETVAGSKLKASPSNTKKRLIGSIIEQEDSKKPKKTDGHDDDGPKTEDTKKQLFQRLFTEKDEIALLEGLYEYTINKGTDPFSDIDGFFDSVKDSLDCFASKAQINDKIKRLKRKYMNNSVRKGKKKGDEPSFSRAHDQKSYELSKKIWAGGEVSTQKRPAQKLMNPKSNGSKAVPKFDLGSSMEIDDMFQGGKDLEECAIECGIEAADETTRAELDEKRRKLLVMKLELFVEKTKLTLKQAKLAFEAAKAADL
jgi:hypothetical protein